ncbi:hypothetical protein [Hyphomicrobium sp.]|uniref:hypothetical protein n=1 Tax=Hyphomicrobium sp. TaxID=82 RepID=UPI001E03CB16|nr:hypothetical protein [Hyphomicrobium sp.]MBY0561479.1 hypothetical protein [Hyphomicrobium sp.]
MTIASVREQIKDEIRQRQHEAPLDERLDTPEGQELLTFMREIMDNAVKIVEGNDEAQGFMFAPGTDDKKGVIIPLRWKDNEEKMQMLTMARLILLANGSTHYVHITEAWGCREEHYDPEIRNADNPYRVEILMCVGVSRNFKIAIQKELFVDANGDRATRDADWLGKRQAKGDKYPDVLETGGLLTELLPPEGLTLPEEVGQKLLAAFQPIDISKKFAN